MKGMHQKQSTYRIYIFTLFLFFYGPVLAQSSGFVSALNQEDVEEVILYPNPAIDHFSVLLDAPVNSITINNILGKEVYRFQSNDENKYPVSNLKRGIYIVRLFDDKNQLIKALRLCKG